MSRWEFMRILEELLADISPNEREEALQYYNDYINDAGKENEAEVLASLGTPEQVAAIVKEGLDGSATGEFTEKGYQGATNQFKNTVTKYENTKSATNQPKKEEQKKESMSTGLMVLIVFLCILGSPVIIGLTCALFGIIISVVATIFSLIIAFVVVTVVLLVVAISLLISAIVVLFSDPLLGVALIAAAAIVAAVGILFLLLTVFLVGAVIPAIFRGIGYILSKIFGKKGGNK